MTAAFHRWQLEGRALEHGFAGTSGSGIRMKTSSRIWKVVQSQPIREEMNNTAQRVRAEMASEGVRILGADCPCILEGDRPQRSVDLRIKVDDLYGAVELKFSRRNLDTACRNANSAWLLKAAKLPGSFLMGGRKYKMNLQVVGALGVSLSGWRLELTRVSTGRAFKHWQAIGAVREAAVRESDMPAGPRSVREVRLRRRLRKLGGNRLMDAASS